MTLLESEGSPQGMLAGVVLALVGPQPDNANHEPFRTLRMYNLSSLISLAQWSISHKVFMSRAVHMIVNDPLNAGYSTVAFARRVRQTFIGPETPAANE